MALINKNEILIPFFGSPLAFIPGQDPMGMLNVADRTFQMLLPGLNNVTERIRYYSFYCWFFDVYARINGSTNPAEQQKFIRRAEYLLALLAAKNNVRGIPGITEAQKNYSSDKQVLSLKEGTGELKDSFEHTYWKNPGGIFGQNYVSSMIQMKLLRDMGDKTAIYIRTRFDSDKLVSGKQLADAFENNIGKEAINKFIDALQTGEITQQAMETIINVFNMKLVPVNSEESRLLIKLLTSADYPGEPIRTYYRRETIRIYLNEIIRRKKFVSVRDFVTMSYTNQGAIDGEVNETLTAWYYFQSDQYWHMVSTGILKALLIALSEKSDGTWMVEKDFIEGLSEEVNGFLVQEGFVKQNASFESLLVIQDETIVVADKTNRGDFIGRIAWAMLLLKKILVENTNKIDELVAYAKNHNLESQSNFIAVYPDLLEKGKQGLITFLKYFLHKYVVMRHQYVAYVKMNNTQSTEKFIREDGLIRHIANIDYGYSSPRLDTLISFLKDLELLNDDRNGLSVTGMELRQKLISS